MNGNGFSIGQVEISQAIKGKKHEFATMQMQNTLMGRYEIARQASLDDFLNKPAVEWNDPSVMPTWRGISPDTEVDFCRVFDRSIGPQFYLSIDVNVSFVSGVCIFVCQDGYTVPEGCTAG